MNVPTEFLRGVLGLLGVGCAYMSGRTLAAVRKGWQKPSRLYGWGIRTTMCLVAVAFRHPVDVVDIMVWALAVVAFTFALVGTSRQKPREDLTSTIFPDEP